MPETFPVDHTTRVARARYDRIAAIYDFLETPMERGRFTAWRQRLWAQVEGPRVIEVGVGTGKNFPFYLPNVSVTAIDFSPKMLERARQNAQGRGIPVDLQLMDVQHLSFPDNTFDDVVASFVFCSVSDPIEGIREIRRVTKPTGKVSLLEHVRPPGLAGHVADLLNPLVVGLYGANINRCTIDNVVRAGLTIERVEDLWDGVVKLIVARRDP